MENVKTSGARGRPRAFDIDTALEKALQVFWRKGYEGTSLTDLTEAMGINRPSLYAAFGNKESLFKKALERYGEGPASYVHEAMKEPTARATVERLIYGAIELQTDPANPCGCLLVQAALTCGEEADPVRQELITRRCGGEALLRQRLERAIAQGELPADTCPADLARFVTTIVQGISVQSTSGASREELCRVAQTALRAWPASPPGH